MEVRDVLEQLDDWRHLPGYQLERRVDVYIGMLLPDILEELLNIEFSPIVIPEFPINKKLMDADNANQSYKIDFMLMTRDLSKLFFVELKTDDASIRTEQLDYLCDVAELDRKKIISGIKKLYIATDRRSRGKYHCLFKLLMALELVVFDASKFERILKRKSHQGIKKTINEEIKVTTSRLKDSEVMLIAPNAEKAITQYKHGVNREVKIKPYSLSEIAQTDAIPRVLKKYLSKWDHVPAGEINIE